MCDLDIDGEPVTDFKVAWTEAPEAESCACCGAEIQSGDRCRVITCKLAYDGQPVRDVACGPCGDDVDTFGAAHRQTLFAEGVEHLLDSCIADEDEEDRATWVPMLDRLHARQAAAKEARA